MIRMRLVAILAALMLLTALGVSAQDQERPSFAGSVFTRVVVDPTTYTPALLAYDRQLVRAIGWAQRISFASFTSYRLSVKHYRQASQNERLARQFALQ